MFPTARSVPVLSALVFVFLYVAFGGHLSA